MGASGTFTSKIINVYSPENYKRVNVSDNNDELKTLCDLGLTLQQARVYLAFVRIGIASVQEASAVANIDRSECYRVSCQLIEKGLITKVLTSPIKYEAIMFDAVIRNLLLKRKNEVSLLEKKTENMLKKMKTKDKPVIINEANNGIYVVQMSPAAVEQVNHYLASVVESFDAVMDVQWFESNQNVTYEGDIRALQRGVKYRMLISDANGTFDIKRFPKYLEEIGFDLRLTTESIATPLSVLDKKAACIFISGENVLKASCLFTKNERMIKIVQHYFDTLWINSIKVEMERSADPQ